MTHDAPRSARWVAITALFVFPLIGPAALVLTMAAPLALVGLFALGPGGLLYYLFLAGWWLPGLYTLLAPPFLLTGILVALAGLIGRRFSLLVAVAATEVAFFAYFAFWYLMPGGIETILYDYANLWAGFSRTPWSAVVILPGTVVSWYVLRPLARRAAPTTPGWDEPISKRQAAVLIAIAVIGGAALGYVLTAHTRLPATAWKDCLAGDYQDNMRGCTAIIDHGADQPIERRVTAFLRRGSAHEALTRDFKRALADYSEAIRHDPSNAGAYVRRGFAYASLGDDQVIADLDTALRLDPGLMKPDNYRIFRARGLALVRKGEFDRAIADHTVEITLSPHYADGYLHRGAAHLAKGEPDRAIADFSEAIRIEPFHPRSYIARGFVYLAQGDNDRALADFDEGIRRLPNNRLTAPAYRGRGEVLERMGNLTDALAAFETALSLDPSDKAALAGRDRTRAALAR